MTNASAKRDILVLTVGNLSVNMDARTEAAALGRIVVHVFMDSQALNVKEIIGQALVLFKSTTRCVKAS